MVMTGLWGICGPLEKRRMKKRHWGNQGRMPFSRGKGKCDRGSAGAIGQRGRRDAGAGGANARWVTSGTGALKGAAGSIQPPHIPLPARVSSFSEG